MGLDATDRGLLEKHIDAQIKGIPALMKTMRSSEVKKFLQIKDESEVVFGMVLGGILEKFYFYYTVSKFVQQVPLDAMFEVIDIVMKRSAEIKDAIFKCG